jgi:hypothetical protein
LMRGPFFRFGAFFEILCLGILFENHRGIRRISVMNVAESTVRRIVATTVFAWSETITLVVVCLYEWGQRRVYIVDAKGVYSGSTSG